MAYRVVESYYRQQHFDFFSRYQSPMYALTFDLDITRLKSFVEASGDPMYLTLCYFFARALQPLEDFRYRVVDDCIVLYDRLDIAATLPAPDGLFSFGYFDYDPDLASFHRRAREAAGAVRERATLGEPRDTNYIACTALPKVDFTGFTHARTGDVFDARPRVAFGKFRDDGGRTTVPVGLEVNHVFIDGAALGDLVERVQGTLDDPRERVEGGPPDRHRPV